MVDRRAREVEAPPRILTVSEAAHLLHIHPNTLRSWSNSGIVRTYRLGRRGDRRFALDDLLSLLTDSRGDTPE